MENCYKIAGIPVSVISLYERIHNLSRDYLTDERPEFTVTISRADIDRERERSAMEREAEKLPAYDFPDDYLETLAVYRKIAEEFTDRNIILFHSTAIEYGGRAYLFTAPSGTGKSTHAALWRKVYKDRVRMINDDKPLIGFDSSTVTVYGTPWNGKHSLGANISAELAGICFLSRGKENRIRRIGGSDALPGLLAQTYRPQGERRVGLMLEMLIRLSSQIPMYRLECNMEDEAARVSFEAMTGEK